MTEEQKKKIKELRLEGLGYKAIANILGLSRDAVRGFCKRYELTGDANVVSLNMQVKKQKNVVCTHCDKPLKHKARGRIRKFCSDACRRKWWVEHQQMRNKSDKAIYKYTCLNCRKEFSVYGNKNRKYCSHSCYIKHRFWEG